jgi:hypothetical protein
MIPKPSEWREWGDGHFVYLLIHVTCEDAIGTTHGELASGTFKKEVASTIDR